MLYNVDLLKIDGQFGVVWFLASSGDKKLKRKQTERVDVRRTCKEIAGLLPVSRSYQSIIIIIIIVIKFIHFYRCNCYLGVQTPRFSGPGFQPDAGYDQVSPLAGPISSQGNFRFPDTYVVDLRFSCR
jgi:hypothetical protein